MYQAALPGGVWTYIPDSPYDILVAIRCDTLYPYAQSLERLQILDYLLFPLPVRQPVEKGRFYMMSPIYDQAYPVTEICPVYQQIDSLPPLYCPLGRPLQILVEHGFQMPYAVPAQ